MIWSVFKIACRVYAAIMAGVVLFQLAGQALTGGMRIEASDIGPMKPDTAAILVAWCIAIIITSVTKDED